VQQSIKLHLAPQQHNGTVYTSGKRKQGQTRGRMYQAGTKASITTAIKQVQCGAFKQPPSSVWSIMSQLQVTLIHQ
jgi:hypothetical protein